MSYSDKYLFQKLNTDDANNALEKGHFRELLNGHVGVTADKTRFLVENIKGNVSISYNQPTEGKVMGSYHDKQTDTIFFFLHKISGDPIEDGIYQLKNDVITLLLQWDGLNFQDRIYQIDYVGGDLTWTDNLNEPRYINVQRCLSGKYIPHNESEIVYVHGVPFTSIISKRGVELEEDISVIRRPPLFPLEVSRKEDVSRVDNNIANNSFQFAYRYVYEGNKYSVISGYSRLVNYATTAQEDFNYLTISIPSDEKQPFNLKKTQLLFRYGNSGEWYIWKDFSDNTKTHDFYNDTLGLIEPNIDEKTLFDDVPRRAKAQAFIENRVIYGNYLKGYNLQKNLAIRTELEAISDVSIPVLVQKYFFYGTKPGHSIYPIGEYAKKSDGLFYEADYDSNTDTLTITGTTGYTIDEIFEAADDGWNYSYIIGNYYLVTETITLDVPTLKKGSQYQVGILFSDFAGRNVGVSTSDDNKIYLEDDPTDTDRYRLKWDLSGVATIDPNWEADYIPDWATTYSILVSKNLSKSFFIQGHTSDMWYKRGDDVYGKDIKNADEIYVDTICLTKNNTGYTFTEGDRIKLYNLDGEDKDFEIQGQEGQFIIIEGVYVGVLSDSHQILFEIYRPLKKDLERRFYEVAATYPIMNPGKTDRSFTTTQGYLNWDSYSVTRDVWNYEVSGYDDTKLYTNTLAENGTSTYEAMNPSDEHYTEWLSDAGRVSLEIENPIERRSTTTICYSGEILPDSNWNESHSFKPLNRYDKISENVTPIVAFSVVNNTLIAHHERNTSTILIGKGITHNVNGDLVVKTDNVIGDHRVHQGGHGCMPSTIQIEDDRMWWLDPNRGFVVRYTAAGTQPITNGLYGVERTFKSICEDIRTNGVTDISAGFDPDTNEYMICIPGDRTYIFSEDQNAWTGSVQLYGQLETDIPECFVHNGHTMYSFLKSGVWKHGGNILYNNFYGTQKNRKLRFVMNTAASKNKVFGNIWLEQEKLSETSIDIVKITTKGGQFTNLTTEDFEYEEGEWKAAVLFDVNTPNMTDGRKNGDRMRAKTFDVEIHSDVTDINPLGIVTVLFDISPFTL